MYVLLFSVLVFVYGCGFVIFFKKRKNTNDFPEPPGLLIFGHVFQLSSTTKIIRTCSNFIKNYGTTVKLNMCLYNALLTSDYKLLEFLINNSRKSRFYVFAKPWLGAGLLLNEGVEWKRNRKIITPAFHFEILKNFVATFESVGASFIQKLGNFDGATSVDIYPLVALYTLDVICETAMGIKINAQDGENSHYVNAVEKMTKIAVNRVVNPVKINDWSFVLTRDYYIQKKLLKILHGFTSDIISARKAEGAEKPVGKMAFLDLLLNSRMLDDDQIRQEVDTFMFAGHDTTAAGISFTLFCLADHPDIQEKLLNEQKYLFGDEKNPEVTYQELQNMKYLDCVIKESLRLYPPAPFVAREAREDLEFDGHVIKKDTQLVLFIYGLHRNPKLFPDPEKFDPDRFMTTDNSHPYRYIPFSAGERNCIGQKFAILEMKSIISKVIRHFKLVPAVPRHDLQFSVEIILKSANGVKIGVTKRI